MDPFDRYEFRQRRVNIQAIIAFAIAVFVAYVIQFTLGFGGGGLFTFLIVIAVGGLWYHIRSVV